MPAPVTTRPYLHNLADTYIMFQIERLHRQAQEHAPVFTMNEVIKEALVKALMATKGNRTQAAKLLKISRSALYRMVERYQLNSQGRDITSGETR